MFYRLYTVAAATATAAATSSASPAASAAAVINVIYPEEFSWAGVPNGTSMTSSKMIVITVIPVVSAPARARLKCKNSSDSIWKVLVLLILVLLIFFPVNFFTEFHQTILITKNNNINITFPLDSNQNKGHNIVADKFAGPGASNSHPHPTPQPPNLHKHLKHSFLHFPTCADGSNGLTNRQTRASLQVRN